LLQAAGIGTVEPAVEDRAPSHRIAVEDRDAAPEGATHPRVRHHSFEVPSRRALGSIENDEDDGEYFFATMLQPFYFFALSIV
jgi:hypothetical protein